MQTALFLLAIGALASGVVIKQPAHKSASLRAKLIKEGTFGDFLAQQHLARANRAPSNSVVASQPFIDYYDDLYLGEIGLGNQNFSVLLDTGSSTLWVIDAACPTVACQGYPHIKTRFDTTKSSSFAKTGQTFVTIFGVEECSGYIATDTLNLAGLVHPAQGFGVATDVPNVIGKQRGDGILGLGWPALAVDGVTPPLQNLLDQLDQPIFTVWLDRRVPPSDDGLGGVITYGGLDKEHCDAQVDYVTLSSRTYWQFPLTGFSFGAYSSDAKAEVISDTGVAWIGAPPSAVAGIVKTLGATYDWYYEMFIVPCNGTTYPDMVFTIGGKTYSIPAENYVADVALGKGNCAVTLFEQLGSGFGPSWILGDTWIRTYCQIHDVGQGRIGFAKSVHSA